MERHGESLTEELGNRTGELEETSPARGENADRIAAAIGETLASAADRLRRAPPSEGRLGTVGKAVTEGLESSGRYVKGQGLTVRRDDVESLIRRYPVQVLLLGVGRGYVLSHLRMRKS
jgi:hypothetical protein